MDAYLDRMPIVAILAGLTPDRAEEVGMALVEAGITILEVPLRGADPAASLESVRILAKCVGDRALVGAGTVLTTEQVRQVRDAGARLIVSPNMDAAVITEARAHGLISLPGVFTPTEALQHQPRSTALMVPDRWREPKDAQGDAGGAAEIDTCPRSRWRQRG